MDFNGYYGGPARLPFLPLTADAEIRDRTIAGGYPKLGFRVKSKTSQQKLPPVSDQMKAWSAALAVEAAEWPRATVAIVLRL